MRSFNDEGISFQRASAWRDRVVTIDTNLIELLSDQTKSLLIDAPDGIYMPQGGFLPILEKESDYYISGEKSLERIQDPVNALLAGKSLYTSEGQILISDQEAGMLAHDVSVVSKAPAFRNISGLRLKAKAVPILFATAFIHRQLMDQVLGTNIVFDHLFGCVYDGPSYGTQLLLGREVKYGIRSVPTYKYFLKEELTTAQEERLMLELAPVFEQIMNSVPIGGLYLPTFTTVLTQRNIRLEFGLDVRTLSYILDKEEEQAAERRKELGED